MQTFEMLVQADPNDLNELAVRLAVNSARGIVEANCVRTTSGGVAWYDTRSIRAVDASLVWDALRFLDLLGGETASYRMVRSKAFPRMVKFEEMSAWHGYAMPQGQEQEPGASDGR